MSKKIIDVSSYQGNIDWEQVKASGVQGAILKVIRKDLTPDRQFERNWAGCEKINFPIKGVYNYSYALSVAKAITDAQKVIEILSGRKVKVWLDVEDASQKGLGITLLKIIMAYQKEIEAAGMEFGVYTGLSFYNTNLKAYANQLLCDFWIARYPFNKTMDIAENPPSNKKPMLKQTLEGWQYSSKGRVPGICGNVDMNLWYGDALKENVINYQRNPYPIPEKLLSLKSPQLYGNDVKWIQYHLVRLGFLPAQNNKGKNNIDGFFGRNTDKALRTAQAHFGIQADGIVGPVTIYVLQYN